MHFYGGYIRTDGRSLSVLIYGLPHRCMEKGKWMTINLIFRIAAVGILVSVLGTVLKHSGRDEQAFLVSLAGLILVFLWIVPYIEQLFETVEKLFSIG